MTLISGFRPLTNAKKNSSLDFAWVLDTPRISGMLLIENLIRILKLKYPALQEQFPVNIYPKYLFIATHYL